MFVAEFFRSVQGEGKFAGTDSVFLRTSGCNLRCWFCDTPYTSWNPEGNHQSWESLADQILDIDCEHVVITGGEPLLQAEVVDLSERLAGAGRFLTFETAGTVFRPVEAGLISLSPKLANSTPNDDPRWKIRHDETRHQPEVVAQFLQGYDCQFKFVIDRPEDVAQVEEYLAGIPEAARAEIFLMPQATTTEAIAERNPWLKAAADERGWRVSPRLHIELFGNTRGT